MLLATGVLLAGPSLQSVTGYDQFYLHQSKIKITTALLFSALVFLYLTINKKSNIILTQWYQMHALHRGFVLFSH